MLAVGAEGGGSGGLLHSIRQWIGDGGAEIEAAADLPRAVRQLGTGGGTSWWPCWASTGTTISPGGWIRCGARPPRRA